MESRTNKMFPRNLLNIKIDRSACACNDVTALHAPTACHEAWLEVHFLYFGPKSRPTRKWLRLKRFAKKYF